MKEPELGDFIVTLSPRHFLFSKKDWHIQVVAPDGRQVWSQSMTKIGAELKARYIVRQLRRGRFEDGRTIKMFRVGY